MGALGPGALGSGALGAGHHLGGVPLGMGGPLGVGHSHMGGGHMRGGMQLGVGAPSVEASPAMKGLRVTAGPHTPGHATRQTAQCGKARPWAQAPYRLAPLGPSTSGAPAGSNVAAGAGAVTAPEGGAGAGASGGGDCQALCKWRLLSWVPLPGLWRRVQRTAWGRAQGGSRWGNI